MELNFNLEISKDELVYTEGLMPIKIRANCKEGCFRRGSDLQLIGETLQAEVLAGHVHQQAEFFGYERQDWLQLILVLPDRQLATMMLRGRSYDTFNAIHSGLLAEGTNVFRKTLEFSFISHPFKNEETGETGSYYSVKTKIISESNLLAAKERLISELAGNTSGLYLVAGDDNPDVIPTEAERQRRLKAKV